MAICICCLYQPVNATAHPIGALHDRKAESTIQSPIQFYIYHYVINLETLSVDYFQL